MTRIIATLIPGKGTPTSKYRKTPPFVGSLFSQWDARYSGGSAAQLSSRASDTLTAREHDVLAMISQGLSNKHIARALEISPETVKSHVKHIFLKLVVGTRAEAVSRATLLGFFAIRSLRHPCRPTNRRRDHLVSASISTG
jgi:DNA-binding CsgD family transcriptional regulator